MRPGQQGDAANGQKRFRTGMAQHQRHDHQTESRGPNLQRAGIAVPDHPKHQRNRADHNRQSQPDPMYCRGEQYLAAQPQTRHQQQARDAMQRAKPGQEHANPVKPVANQKHGIAHCQPDVCDGVSFRKP